MCRNIKTLFNFDPPATNEEVRAASEQFVRKLSGFTKPSKANEAAFGQAIDEFAAVARRLLDSLSTNAPARDREVEAVMVFPVAAETAATISGPVNSSPAISMRRSRCATSAALTLNGTSKSAVSRRFVALSRKKMKAWLASDLSELDLLVIQIDGLHAGDHVLMAAIGVDGNGDKHVLAVVEGATENTVVVQALIDNLLARGLDPTLPRLFIVDGAKALSKAIRNTFGVAAAIQRCQVHKGRNIIERLPQHLHASVKKALRQAWDQDDANKAERLLRNLVRRLEHEEPGVSGSILEGLDEILTVIRPGLPHELRRSLACTNIVENALGTVRQVTRNVKRWRHAEMALRWTAAGLLEAQKTFRRLKAYRQLPILRNALQEHLRKAQADSAIETIMKAA